MRRCAAVYALCRPRARMSAARGRHARRAPARGRVPAAHGHVVPVARRLVVGQQPRRRDRARGRPAADRVADPGPAARGAGRRCSSGCRGCCSACYAGVLADRVDRRRLVVGRRPRCARPCSPCSPRRWSRGSVGVVLVLVAMLLLGVAEVFADTATGTLLPMVVDKADLGIGNARLMAGLLTTNQLVGPAVGAALFAGGLAWPFVTQAVCVALGALLVSRMRLPRARPDARSARTSARTSPRLPLDLGQRARSAPSRSPSSASTSPWARRGRCWCSTRSERLGLGAVGFGLLTTVMACGGIAGTAGYDWLERHASLADIMRVGLDRSRPSPTSAWR